MNLGPVINSVSNEAGPAISTDGLSLYFQSNRPGGFGRSDIYVAQRPTVGAAWGPPRNLGPVINATGAFWTGMPAQSADGKLLFFCSDRPGGVGGLDIWVSRRDDVHDDFAWGPPSNLGADVNSAGDDCDPALLVDPETGVLTLYFASLNRPGGSGDWDIFTSAQAADGHFGVAVPVSELNTATRETSPNVRRDGLELIYTFSALPGNAGLFKLQVATRESTAAPWSSPVALPAPIDAPGFTTRAARLSADGTTMFFVSNRPGGLGGPDIWVSTRTRQ
jgi:hypothetical protein